MEPWLQAIVTIISSVFASSGLWALLMTVRDKRDAKTQMIRGLGHDRIMYLGTSYIERGYITSEEYENLYEYLYEPYEKLGGNGSAKHIMQEVEKLPMHKSNLEAKNSEK